MGTPAAKCELNGGKAWGGCAGRKGGKQPFTSRQPDCCSRPTAVIPLLVRSDRRSNQLRSLRLTGPSAVRLTHLTLSLVVRRAAGLLVLGPRWVAAMADVIQFVSARERELRPVALRLIEELGPRSGYEAGHFARLPSLDARSRERLLSVAALIERK